MKIAMITQARTSSTRLPSKVLMHLPYKSNITVLEQDIRRMKESKYLNEIIIATTNKVEDDEIVKIAQKEKVKFFRGSEEDVLSRYYFAAKENLVDVIVRVTSDCPCIDGEIIDLVIGEYLKDESCDYVSTVLERTFPIGLDVEVIKFSALKKTYEEAYKSYQREHVTDYIYENPQIYKLKNVLAATKYRYPRLRVTLDTMDDYMLLCAVYDELYKVNRNFSAEEVIKLLLKKPWLNYINKASVQKKDSYDLNSEIIEGANILKLQGMKRASEILLKQYKGGK